MKTELPRLHLGWQHTNKLGGKLIDEFYNQFIDKRKASLKDEKSVKTVIASLMGYRGMIFEIFVNDAPKEMRETLKSTVDCLVGRVLKRSTVSKVAYEWDEKFLNPEAKVWTISKTNKFWLQSKHGAIFRDNTYKSVPFDNVMAVAGVKPERFQVVAPYRTMAIFSGMSEAPSLRWLELDDEIQFQNDETENLLENLTASIAERGHREAIPVLPMSAPGCFLTSDAARLQRLVGQCVTRTFNKPNLTPALQITNKFGKITNSYGTTGGATKTFIFPAGDSYADL